MLALNGADPLNGPRQWGSLLFCLVIVLSLQRAEGSTEETGSSYTKIRILPAQPIASRWLSRPHRRPLLDLFLLAEQAVNLGQQLLGAGFLPTCHRVPMFDKALDQHVLPLGDPRPLFWGE